MSRTEYLPPPEALGVSAIYNEIEPYAAEWIENLARAGHVAPGRVDRRSIADLAAADVAGRGQRHFFAGIGVWSYALRLAGWPDDVPVWTGSCPCQPFSQAGRRRGTADARHLWPTWFRLIAECRPAVVLGEQVASPDGLAWFDAVRADLEGAGYAVGAADLCAAGVGAPHIRQRLWFVAVADDDDEGRIIQRELSAVRDAQPGRDADRCGAHGDRLGDSSSRGGRDARDPWTPCEWVTCNDPRHGFVTRPVEPGTFPLAHGSPSRVVGSGAVEIQPRTTTLKCYGNAIVAEVAATWIDCVIDALIA